MWCETLGDPRCVLVNLSPTPNKLNTTSHFHYEIAALIIIVPLYFIKLGYIHRLLRDSSPFHQFPSPPDRHFLLHAVAIVVSSVATEISRTI